MPPVPIEDSEELALRPAITYFLGWLLNVEHDADPIFVIIADYTLIRVCCIRFDDAVFFHRVLCRFKIR